MAKRNDTTSSPQMISPEVFYNRWSRIVDRRELPPVAMVGLTAAMLGNVSVSTLVNTFAPALREMVEAAEQDVEAFFEDDRVFTFAAWLESFEFDPHSDDQADSWIPFVEAMKAVAGGVEVPVFNDDGSFYNRYAGMLLWLVVHVVFDTVSSEPDEVDHILPANAWLPSLVPDDWNEWIAWDDEGYTDALGIVFGHLYNEAREGWTGASEPAPESSDLGMRFLLPGWRQEERGAPSKGSIGERLAHSDWTLGIDPRRDGPVGWRHHAALLLQDADIDAIMENLMPVLDELAGKVTDVVLHGARDEPIAFDMWLETWRQTFTHWDDPVRQMVSHFARTGDGAEFIKTFHLVDGLVLLDWLLATHEGWCDRAVMLHALRTAAYPSPEAPISPGAPASMAAVRPRKMRSLEWYVREAYERFRNGIDREALPAPETIELEVNFDRLYP